MQKRRLIVPAQKTQRSSVSTDFVKMLDSKFAAHEQRSSEAISELRDSLLAMLLAAEAKNEHRAEVMLALLTGHSTKLELHDLRIVRVEEKAKELDSDRKLASGDVKRSVLAVFVGAVLALLGALVSSSFRK